MSNLGEQIQHLERLLADGQIELALEGYEQLFARMPTDDVLRNRVNFLRDSLHRHAPDWQVRTYVISPRAVAEAHILATRYVEALEILEWLLEAEPSDTGLARRVAMVRAMRNGTTDAGIEPTASTSLMTPEMLVEAHLAGGDVAAALLLLKSLAHKRPNDQRLHDRLRGLQAAWGRDDAELARRTVVTVDETVEDAAVAEPIALTAAEATDDARPAVRPEPPAVIAAEAPQADAKAEAPAGVATAAAPAAVATAAVAAPDPDVFAAAAASAVVAPPSDNVAPPPDEQQTVARARPLSAGHALPGKDALPPPLPRKRAARSVTDPKRDGYGILRGLLADAEEALAQNREQRLPTNKVRSPASPLPPEPATSPGKQSARLKAAGDDAAPPAPAGPAVAAPASAPAAEEPKASVRGRRRRKKVRQAHDTGSAPDLIQGDPHQPLESKLLQSPLESTAAHDVELFDIHEALTAPDGRSLSSRKNQAAVAPVAATNAAPKAETAAASAAGPADDTGFVEKTARPEDFDDQATAHDEGLPHSLTGDASAAAGIRERTQSEKLRPSAAVAPAVAAVGRPVEFTLPPPTTVLPGRRESSASPPVGEVVLPGAPARSRGQSALGNGFEPPPPTTVLPGRRGQRDVPTSSPAAGANAAPSTSDLFDDDDDPTLLDKSPLVTTGAGEEAARGPTTSAMRHPKRRDR